MQLLNAISVNVFYSIITMNDICGAGVVIIYATYAYRLWDERIY